MSKNIQILTGNSNRKLSEEVADYLEIPIADASVQTFSDGEISVRISDNVRGDDTFVIQSTCNPVNNNIMELLLMIDALKRASAGRITAVIPYYGYARQDRKVQPRVPISSKLVADLIQTAGADRVLTIDLHAGQIQGFFNIPVDHIYAKPVLLDYIKNNYPIKNLVVVSPDTGGVERARAFAKKLTTPIAIIDKRREEANVCEVMHVIGDVKGKDILMLDDMIDTAGTVVQGSDLLKKSGARNVYVACTHGVLSGPAIERINNSSITEVLVTNTIPVEEKVASCDKITALSVDFLIGEAIERINKETSISSLFV